MESIWDGPELYLISADGAKSNGLHPSHRGDPNMIATPRAKEFGVAGSKQERTLET